MKLIGHFSTYHENVVAVLEVVSALTVKTNLIPSGCCDLQYVPRDPSLKALKIAIISSSQSPSQMEPENHPNVTNVALIVGVTGMAGLSLAEALKSPNALGSPWQVYGTARRPEPSWFPSSIIDKYITFDATNSGDTHDKLAYIANKVTHVFWVAIQIRENEEANVKVNAAMLTNVLNVLKSGPASRLSHITLQTGTQHSMGPVHDPAHSAHLIPHEPPFSEGLPRLPYPNFLLRA